MSMTTVIQNYQQAEGPWRPKASVLAAMLDSIPNHIEIRAISVNGQTGIISIETYHEGLDQVIEFDQKRHQEARNENSPLHQDPIP